MSCTLFNSTLARAAAALYVTLHVTSAVGAACSVSGGEINLGVPDARAGSVSVVSDVAITCVDGPSNGTLSYSIRIDNGQNSNGTERRMRNPVDGSTIRYQIYQDGGFSVVWGNTAASAATGTVRFNRAGFSTATIGVSRIRASINAQDVANATVGAYADKLITTIEF